MTFINKPPIIPSHSPVHSLTDTTKGVKNDFFYDSQHSAKEEHVETIERVPFMIYNRVEK
jgi:hypothetical protein